MKILSQLTRSLPKPKLLLLSFDWTRPKDPPMSLGHASILAKLHQAHIPVLSKSWSVNQPTFDVQRVFDEIWEQGATIPNIAIGTYVWHEPHTQYLLKKLRQHGYTGNIILGGPQVSYTKYNLEHYYPDANVFIRGYAEDALTTFLQARTEKPLIAGVQYAGEPDLGLSAFVDLEHLPSPYLTGIIKPQPFLRWETQRGCPFRCAFCQHRESDQTMTRRQLNHSRLKQEAQWILDNPIINDIAVLDPTFNSGPHYLNLLEILIAGQYRGKLALQCRIEMVKTPFLDLVQALNQTAEVVLEFGLQTTNTNEAKIIDRPNNMKRVKQVLQETYARGIATEVSLIFGLPEQTLASFVESIEFCKAHKVPTIYAYPLMLLRGTPLHDAKEKLRLVESSDVDLSINRVQDNIPHVISSPTFSYEQWCAMAKAAEELDEYNSQSCQKRSEPTSNKMQSTLTQTSFWQTKSDTKNQHPSKKDILSNHDTAYVAGSKL